MPSHTREGWRVSDYLNTDMVAGALSNAPSDLVELIGHEAAGTGGIQGYMNHFYTWEGPVAAAAAPGTGGWIATQTAGGAGNAVIDVDDSRTYGVLKILNDDADNDNTQIQLNGSSFKYVAGKRMWFGIRCALSDVDLIDFGFGLIIESDTNMLNTFPTDGFFFEKGPTATKMDFHVRKDGTSTEDTEVDSAVMADATFRTYQFYVDTDGLIHYYVEGVRIGSVADTDANICNDEDLTLAIQLQNGSAVAQHALIDWVYAFQER